MSLATSPGLAARSRTEVARWHEALERWLTGPEPGDDCLSRIERSLAPDFREVTPEGEERGRADVLAALRSARGTAGDELRIRCRAVVATALPVGHCLVTYERWDEAAGGRCGRRATALLREEPEAPLGVAWLHVHETWMGGRVTGACA